VVQRGEILKIRMSRVGHPDTVITALHGNASEIIGTGCAVYVSATKGVCYKDGSPPLGQLAID
jgi:hypothetical protein